MMMIVMNINRPARPRGCRRGGIEKGNQDAVWSISAAGKKVGGRAAVAFDRT